MIKKLLIFFLGIAALLFAVQSPANAQNIGEGCWDNGGSCNRYNTNESQCSSTAGCTWQEIPSVFGEGGGGCRGTIKQYRNCICSDFSDDDDLCTATNLPGCRLSGGSCVGTLEKEIFGDPRARRDSDNSLFGDQAIPGFSCGDSTDPQRSACCYNAEKEINLQPDDPEFLCFKVGPVEGPCLSSAALKVFEGFFENSEASKAINEIRNVSNATGGCVVGVPSTDDPSAPDCKCVGSDLTKACKRYITNPDERQKCIDCTLSQLGVWTGLGCIKATAAGFAQSMMGIGVSFAGILALLCIIYSAFLLQTSQGNPERIKKAREYLNSCIIGLILILFAVLILQVIGVNILRLPGFSP